MLVVTCFRELLNGGEVGEVSFFVGGEKETEFVPLTLALRGRGLHWHDSNSCR